MLKPEWIPSAYQDVVKPASAASVPAGQGKTRLLKDAAAGKQTAAKGKKKVKK